VARAGPRETPQKSPEIAMERELAYRTRMPPSSAPATKPNPLDAEPFALKSIAKSPPPEGVDTDNWHRYVIIQGKNTIVGQLQGTKASTERAVLEIIERLNERRRGKTGRVQLSPGRKKKGTPPPQSSDD
jgi:hypothetical protein